ncbi:hypothetical protein RJ639_027078, partial [Escallonia herrerae]
MDDGYVAMGYNVNNATDSAQFTNLLGSLLFDLRERAASSGVRKYAADVVNYTSLLKIYGLEQCTPDISKLDCGRCLDMAMKIAYVLTIPKPIVDEAIDKAIQQTAMKQKQRWEEDDTYCKGYILGGLSDTLYDVYEIKYANSTAKELWNDLDSKYKTEGAGNKKFLITWKECRKELKQKKDAMTMQELVKYIQVEENSQNLDRLELEDNKSSKALMVDHGSLSGSKQIEKVKTQSMRIKFTPLRKWGKE